jgi:O-antigen/teichoic acid export membrane protein
VAALVAGTIAIEIFAQQIVRLYLGPQFVPATTLLRVIIMGALPWGLYVTLKSVVDARHVRAINTRNMLIAVIGFGVTAISLRLVWPSSMAVVVAFVCSLYVLGILTIRQAYLITKGWKEPQPTVFPDTDIRSAI